VLETEAVVVEFVLAGKNCPVDEGPAVLMVCEPKSDRKACIAADSC